MITQQVPASFFDRRDDTIVSWLGSAGALINTRGTVLFIDPVITTVSRNGEQVAETGHRLKTPFPIQASDVPRADAVLYTHADGDHFGRKTAEILNVNLKPVFIAPPPVQIRLQEMGVVGERIVTARDGASIQVGEAEVVVTPALHDAKGGIRCSSGWT